ncbi:MAG: hybrid sensor histidine kinase/response regulator [Anaerolineales bacterium]
MPENVKATHVWAQSEPEALPNVQAPESRPAPEAARPRLTDETIRVPTAKLDVIMAEAGELQVARLAAEQRLTELRDLVENIETWEAQWRKLRSHSRRLQRASETQGRDGLLPSHEVHTLLEFLRKNETHLRMTRTRLGDLRRQFDADVRRLAQLMADLQDDVRRTRLLPISTVLDVFPRMVRDLARDLGKEVNLVLQGGQIEVDRSLLEQIKDPLTHLLRNCLDHGIESPARRLAMSKPREGTLTLSVSQQGGNIRIEVADDGAGIDIDRVKESATKKGIITAEAAATLSDREALWLIFRSGLSTSPIITDLSGRGVGMDVVREKIERLNGLIDVENFPGRGTRFVFSLPLTVATTLCLLARAGSQIFGLPITNVVRIVHVRAEEIGHAEGRQVIRVDGQPIALVRLANVLELDAPTTETTRTGRQPVIILGFAERRVAFLVDDLRSAQEVIIKSLPQPLLRVRHITGATILGTGEVVVILNVADLLRSASRSTDAAAARPALVVESPARSPVILVADDSITTRTLEKNILETAGYHVQVAADGMEAWSMVQGGGCDLLVSDVNMPRLDGFELTQKVRADNRFKTLPVILVTSLDSREDREHGVRVGADAYIVKGAFDQDVLLSAIRQLI